jgi:hypothetical protein
MANNPARMANCAAFCRIYIVRPRPGQQRCGAANTRSITCSFSAGICPSAWAVWWARQDSNLQPSGYEPLALTIELRARRRGTVASLQHKPESSDASAQRSLVANEACASRRGERRRRVLDRVARLRRRSSPFRDSPVLHYCNATVNLQVEGTNPTYRTLGHTECNYDCYRKELCSPRRTGWRGSGARVDLERARHLHCRVGAL